MGSYYVGAKYNHLTNPDTLTDIIDDGPVDEGDKIGEMNTTGNDSTGVHLTSKSEKTTRHIQLVPIGMQELLLTH